MFFLLFVIICVPPIILDSCFGTNNLLIITKKVKCIPDFQYFTVFLKNRNIISKMKRSKVTDYAALTSFISFKRQLNVNFLCFDYAIMIWLHQQKTLVLTIHTIQSSYVTASYKFRSLKHVLSRGGFKPSNERVQTFERQIS